MITLIAKREFSVLARSKSQQIGIIVMALLIIAGGVVAKIFLADDGEPPAAPDVYIGVETQMSEYSATLSAAGATAVESDLPTGGSEQWIKDQTHAAQEAVDQAKDGEAIAPDSAGDVATAINTEIVYMALGGTPEKPLIYTSEGSLALLSSSFGGAGANGAVTYALVLSTVEKIAGAPLDQAQIAALTSSINPTIVPVTTEKSTGFDANPLGYLTSIVAVMILFMAVVTGMTTISQGVVEEKSSRVVEILLSTVKPRKLLLGKLLGIGTFVLVQITIWLACAAVSIKIAGFAGQIDLGARLLWILGWVIVGFFVFSTLVGGVAAMVSRQEDLAAVQAPIIFGMVIPFYLAVYLVPFQPDSLLTRILSFIPGFSSFMMPMRQGLDAVPTWELALALVLAIVAIPLLAALSGRIYENSILRMGKRVSLKEALRLGN